MKKTIFALIYDFDKTLATQDMQNYEFIPSLGMTPEEFWNKTTEFGSKEKVESILSYMYMMIACAKEKNIPLTKKYLNDCGKNIKFYPGVDTWFKRINEYGKSKGIKVEHYLVSSGNLEIIQGSPIYKKFKRCFGCEFLFDEKTKEAYWPKVAINYTQKTQYIFRISKGVYDQTDDENVNKKTTNRRVRYENMVYIGDGMTDIPSMVLINQQGGSTIAIYKDENNKTLQTLLNDKRCNFVFEANYKENSQLEKTVKRLIDKAAINAELQSKDKKYIPG